MFRLQTEKRKKCVVEGCENLGAPFYWGKNSERIFDVMCLGHMRLRHAIKRGESVEGFIHTINARKELPLDRPVCTIAGCSSPCVANNCDGRPMFEKFCSHHLLFTQGHSFHRKNQITDYTLPLPYQYIDRTLCCIEGCTNKREIAGQTEDGQIVYKTRCSEHKSKKKKHLYKPKKCKIEGCVRIVGTGKTLCYHHLYRQKQGLPMDYVAHRSRNSLVRRVCAIDGCNNLQVLKDTRNGKKRYRRFCSKHIGHNIKIGGFGQCPICGWYGPLTKHRIKQGKDGGRYEKNNIQIACPNCHSLLDRGIDPKTWLKGKRTILALG